MRTQVSAALTQSIFSTRKTNCPPDLMTERVNRGFRNSISSKSPSSRSFKALFRKRRTSAFARSVKMLRIKIFRPMIERVHFRRLHRVAIARRDKDDCRQVLSGDRVKLRENFRFRHLYVKKKNLMSCWIIFCRTSV
jgi:hypothetical protein